MSCGSETSYVCFSGEQNGEALRLVPHPDDRSLLSLPWPPKNRIFSSILYPDSLQIDLRNPTTVPFSLTYVNRATMHKRRDLLSYKTTSSCQPQILGLAVRSPISIAYDD